ncbi:unnamed protein product [Rhizoctonia solani]|uniref:Extracellular metalloproteinase n=1 Tax=Rhizoctonia solani TaxID=456999 RepID=A0A8H2WUZ7_9AGAM|nr:unnamed protein product [Rhizoctonia solani]
MVSLASLSVVALLIASGAIAAPWHYNIPHHTHRSRGVGPTGISLVSYHPPSVFEGYGVDGAPFQSVGQRPEDIAKSFLQDKLGVIADGLTRHAGHTYDGVSYEYFTQNANGIPIVNAVANVAIKDGKVVSYGASFIKLHNVAPKEPTLDQVKATALAEEAIDGRWNQSPVKLEYVVRDDGSCVLAHVVQVQRPDGAWKELFVDAHQGDIVNVVDFVADSSYRVVPFDKQDPIQGYGLIENPEDKNASPDGWHESGHDIIWKGTTSGNNVNSYKGVQLGTTSQSGPDNSYDYAYDKAKEPDVDPNVDAARVNAFYTVNMMHDLTYKYGFIEAAYNFQNNNFGKGGKGFDSVQVSVQDPSGTNNANFATPPDGAPGQMRMFTWNYTNPNRDGALENDIIVHEYMHGVSNRLTGGGTGRCLQSTEAGGMGEGWSDAMADITEAKTKPIPDFTLGSYVVNNPKGIRSYPYSTNMATNPLTYASLASRDEVHAIGEVWAVTLHELLNGLVEKCGLSKKLDPSEESGNSIVLHLVMDGFQLQPCNPTFISARDAIIQADANRYKGKHKCTIWKAFAKRGLGKGTDAHTDNYDVPPGC